jgi:hypothetical protein
VTLKQSPTGKKGSSLLGCSSLALINGPLLTFPGKKTS